MSERPATRADLRAHSWSCLRRWVDDPERSGWALHNLAILDADERDDPEATAIVAYWLRRAIVETSPEGRRCLTWRDPDAGVPIHELIESLARSADLTTTVGRARFVAAILPRLRTIRNPVLRDGYLQQLRQASGVEERVLLEALHRTAP
jgi:DnaB-helicase binding domain of primase